MTPQLIDSLSQSGIATLILIVIFVGVILVLAPSTRAAATTTKQQNDLMRETLNLLANSQERQNEFSRQQLDFTKKQIASQDRANELSAQQTSAISKGFSVVPAEVTKELFPKLEALTETVNGHVDQADAIKQAILSDLQSKHAETIAKADGLSSQLTKEVMRIIAALDEMKANLLTVLVDATTGFDPTNPSDVAKAALDAIAITTTTTTTTNGAGATGSEQVA